MWCVPPKENEAFVYHMEDVLTLYQQTYDPKRPRVNVDEGSKQLVSSGRASLPMSVGKAEREDYEYEREGFCSVFLACEALTGKVVIQVRPRRTKQEWAEFIRDLVDVHYPDADTLVLVMDNLNTHSPASLYKAFSPEEAWRLSQKLEIHYTPVHGSWLNVAEIELSILARQALDERLASVQEVQERVEQWLQTRSEKEGTIDWQFTTADARMKLKHLYPKLSNEA